MNPKFSIQRRIVLLLGVIAIGMIAGYFFSNQLEGRRINKIMQTEKEKSAIMLERAISFNSKSLNNFVFDYTYWDDMVNFTKTADPQWALENLDASIGTFNIDYAWVYRPDLSLIYTTRNDSVTDLPTAPIPFGELQSITSGLPLNYFFIRNGNDLIQISEGSIHPTDDPERLTKPSGFLIVGRVWTKNYLKTIGSLIGTELELQIDKTEANYADSTVPQEFRVINYKKLMGPGNTIKAVVSSTGVVDVAKEFQADAKSRLRWLAIALIFILLIVSLVLINMINRPLRLLVRSLADEDPDQISELVNRKTEFGQIARMITDSFAQKKNLMDEIQERIRIQSQLVRAKEKAEESDRLKTAFLNNISHEIRTPINAIVGFSDLINDPRLEADERMEFTAIITESSYRLMGVITDLINLSTVESGQEVLKEENFSLNVFMEEIHGQFKQMIDHSKIKLNLDLALTDVHSYIIADKTKLHQIIANLLKNSVKFTKEGRIDFGYAIRNAQIEFFIKDTGIGIPKDKFETIFARFQQADDSLSRKFGGAGLGLPISKAYVELMGGNMWFNSELNKGTEFFFTIPLNSPRVI